MERAVDTVEDDPVTEAIESYVEGSADSSSDAGFPWAPAAALLLVVLAVTVALVVLRRRG